MFSYDRRVTVDRARRRVSVTTRRFWVWRSARTIAFERIDRIILRAQELPGFGLWSFLTLRMAPSVSSAFTMILLGLAGGRDEFLLFTIWETEPDDPLWLEALTSALSDGEGTEEEGTEATVRLLQQYLAVPVSSH